MQLRIHSSYGGIDPEGPGRALARVREGCDQAERAVATHPEIAHVVEEDHAPVAVGTMRLAQQGPNQRVAAARLVHYGGAIGIEVFAKALNALR